MGVISLLLAVVVPAFTSVGNARQTSSAAYSIEGALETARAYAKANSTYTWVGFFEEPYTGTAGTAGTGRVVVSVVASKDGTSIYPPTGAATSLAAARLLQVNKLAKLDNVHLDVLTANDVATRTTVPTTDHQISSNSFDQSVANGVFTYPLSSTTPTYRFYKVVQFNPLGDAARIFDTPTQLMEVGVRPSRNNTVDSVSKAVAAIQVTGIGGAVRIYQP